MRIFRQRALVAPFVSVGLVLFGLSSCAVEEKKRNKDDDCDTDSDCDDDEFCDEDGECERRLPGSGGTSSGTAGMGGTSTGTAGSSVGTAGTSSSGGSGNSSSDTNWCTDGCETASICPDALPLSDCVSGCLSNLASMRSIGCGAQYEAYVECGLTTDFCDGVAVVTVCEAEANALINCAPSAPAG